jgi:hypothetical protein
MAVVSYAKIHDGRDGETEVSDAGKSTRSYTEVWRVKTDSNTDDATVVEAVCPKTGAVYPYDSAARCRRVRASNASFSKLVWVVTCAYSTGREIEENPTDDPAEIEWSTDQYSKIYVRDINGNWICTTAGELYDPPPEGDDSRWVIRIKKNLAAIPAWILTYRNAVNSAQVTIDGVTIGARCAKMSGIRISPVQYRNEIAYRALEMSIQTNVETWDLYIENAGFYEVGSGSACGRSKIQVCGKDVVKPWPLDADGYAIESPTPSTVVFNAHRIYPEMDFSVLPLT